MLGVARRDNYYDFQVVVDRVGYAHASRGRSLLGRLRGPLL